MPPAPEAQLDAVVDERLALQALPDPDPGQQVDGVLLEHARPHALLHVLAVAALEHDDYKFNAHFIVGGQVKGEPPGLMLIYPQGNPLFATEDSPFLQIGETKYGRPILDRQRKLDEALGVVLFIDEAHQFGDKDDPAAREAIEAIVPFSWNRRNNLVIVLAGYSERMIDFFDMDPGLPRRFPKLGRLEFADYTADQLWDMTRRALSRRGWSVDPDVETAFRMLVRRRSQRGGFGNAGGVDNLISEVIANHDAGSLELG